MNLITCWCSVPLSISCAFVLAFTGCSPSATNTPAGAPTSNTQSAAAQTAPPVDGQRAEFADFEFTLPKGFEKSEVPEGSMPPNMRIGVWKSMIDKNTPAALFLANSMTDAKNAQSAKKNMRQVLVDYSAGTTDSMGIKIQNRGPTETTEINGIPFTHFKWIAQRSDGKPLGGTVHGFVEGDTTTMLMHIAFEGDAQSVMNEMQQHIATFRRK